MPTRIIRDGILTSDAVNSLDWEAEVFYRRLMSVVDDFGRYDARPSVLRSALYALKLDSMRENSVQRCLEKCAAARLIVLYTVDGKPYLEICKFGQRTRTAAKWPAPDSNLAQSAAPCRQSAAICRNLPQSAGIDEGESEGGDVDECGDVGESSVATQLCDSPPSAAEVRRVMGSLAIATLTGKLMDECVERYLLAMEACEWRDSKNDRPIRRWKPHAKLWAKRFAENEAKKPTPSTPKRKDCNDPSRYH